MFITWLSFAVIGIKAASDSFVKTKRNCYNFEHFESRDDSSLAHCSMICLTRHQCQALSFDVKKRDCRLHHFLATKCSASDTKDQVTLQRKQPVESCHFETPDFLTVHHKDQGKVDLAANCGEAFLVFPMVFEVKSSACTPLVFTDKQTPINTIPIDGYLMFLSFCFHQYGTPVFILTNASMNTYVVRADQRNVYEFWIKLVNQRDGGNRFIMGQGRTIEKDTVFNVSIEFEFDDIQHVEASSVLGSAEWTFYMQV